MSHLELSVSLPTWFDEGAKPPSWSAMRDLARQAEAVGFDAVFVADHSGFAIPDGGRTEFWDGWTLLPALAEATSRVAIGPFVAVPSFRHPVALARMAAALDEVSGGRLILGLGSGGLVERAWRVLGVSSERLFTRFEEAVTILLPLLRQGSVDFQGEWFTALAAALGPAGPRQGGIPIWIGVKGPRMMRLAARWADAVNFGQPLVSLEDVQSHMIACDSACREVGRDPSTVRRTGWALVSFATRDADPASRRMSSISGTPEEIAGRLHAFHRAGLDHLSLYIEPGDEPTSRTTLPVITATGLERFAPVIATLKELGARETV